MEEETRVKAIVEGQLLPRMRQYKLGWSLGYVLRARNAICVYFFGRMQGTRNFFLIGKCCLLVSLLSVSFSFRVEGAGEKIFTGSIQELAMSTTGLWKSYVTWLSVPP